MNLKSGKLKMKNTYHRTVEPERWKNSASLDIEVLLLPETIPCKYQQLRLGSPALGQVTYISYVFIQLADTNSILFSCCIQFLPLYMRKERH